jgi:hypothetical protein
MCYERGHIIDYHCVSCVAEMPPLSVTRKWCQSGPGGRNHQAVHPEAQCQNGFPLLEAEPTRSSVLLFDADRPDPAHCNLCVELMRHQAASMHRWPGIQPNTVSTGAMEGHNANQAHPETTAQGGMQTHAPVMQTMHDGSRNMYAWAPGGSRVIGFDGTQQVHGQEEAADRMAEAVAEDMYQHQQAYQ